MGGPEQQIINILDNLSHVTTTKTNILIDKGFVVTGLVLRGPHGEIAIIDHGRVTWNNKNVC